MGIFKFVIFATETVQYGRQSGATRMGLEERALFPC